MKFLQRQNFQRTAATVCAIFLISCNETLPLQNDPILPLTGSVELFNWSTYRLDGPMIQAQLAILPSAKNLYDETLQGYGDFTGVIELKWERDTAFRKTFTLDRSSLSENRRYKYDAATNILTMDQNDEIVYFHQWDFVTDDGRRVDSSFALKVDMNCWGYVLLPRGRSNAIRFWNPRKFAIERFIVSGYIKPFKDLAAIRIPPHPVEILYETFLPNFCKELPFRQ